MLGVMTTDLSALVASLQSGNAAQRQTAAEKLSQMGTDVAPAAVALVEACGRNDDARESVVAALEELGPPPVADVAKLADLLHDPSLDVAYWAATLLGRLEGAAAPAVSNLAQALAGHAELAVRQRAAWALGKIGPPAAPARAELEIAAASQNVRLASLARAALDSLSP
jgi:HEAT repeat protein